MRTILFLLGALICCQSEILLSVKDYEKKAKQVLENQNRTGPGAWIYLESGAMDDITIKENILSFRNYVFRPNVMRDVSRIDTTLSVVGSDTVSIPIGLAPSAIHELWHDDGELATVSGVSKAGSFMILSSASSKTIEEVGQISPNTTKWFQMFLPNKDPSKRNLTLDMMKRAEIAGFKAIVFTLDSPVNALRYSSKRINFNFKEHGRMRNFDPYENYQHFRENRLIWKDFEWIKNLTPLPILVKGILTREDAREAELAGLDGIIVSNHGGRQLDSGLSSLDALPEIIDEVRQIPVYFDGGIRSGIDVFKALALGARAVFIGRAALYGLIVNGTEGVENILNILKQELITTMGQCGCSNLRSIGRQNVRHKLEYALKSIQFG